MIISSCPCPHLSGPWPHSPTYSRSSCPSQWCKYPSRVEYHSTTPRPTHCHRATRCVLSHAAYQPWTPRSTECHPSTRIHPTLHVCCCSSPLSTVYRPSIGSHPCRSSSCHAIHLPKSCLTSIHTGRCRVFCHLCSHHLTCRRCWTFRTPGLISYLWTMRLRSSVCLQPTQSVRGPVCSHRRIHLRSRTHPPTRICLCHAGCPLSTPLPRTTHPATSNSRTHVSYSISTLHLILFHPPIWKTLCH